MMFLPQSAATDSAYVRPMLQEFSPMSPVGLATGKKTLFVLDVVTPRPVVVVDESTSSATEAVRPIEATSAGESSTAGQRPHAFARVLRHELRIGSAILSAGMTSSVLATYCKAVGGVLRSTLETKSIGPAFAESMTSQLQFARTQLLDELQDFREWARVAQAVLQAGERLKVPPRFVRSSDFEPTVEAQWNPARARIKRSIAAFYEKGDADS